MVAICHVEGDMMMNCCPTCGRPYDTNALEMADTMTMDGLALTLPPFLGNRVRLWLEGKGYGALAPSQFVGRVHWSEMRAAKNIGRRTLTALNEALAGLGLVWIPPPRNHYASERGAE